MVGVDAGTNHLGYVGDVENVTGKVVCRLPHADPEDSTDLLVDVRCL